MRSKPLPMIPLSPSATKAADQWLKVLLGGK
jgi:hypothetical protein